MIVLTVLIDCFCITCLGFGFELRIGFSLLLVRMRTYTISVSSPIERIDDLSLKTSEERE